MSGLQQTINNFKDMSSARRLNIGILMGGRNSEHEVSLLSGKMVIQNLNYQTYRALPILISRSGVWNVSKNYIETSEQAQRWQIVKLPQKSFSSNWYSLLSLQIDLIFIALHGKHGEDGEPQGFLETLQIPYSGSGILGSAITIDKVISKKIYQHHRILTPHSICMEMILIRKEPHRCLSKIKTEIGFPCVLKIPDQGSSQGMGIARKPNEAIRLFQKLKTWGSQLLIEKYIQGREVTCAVIDLYNKNKVVPSPLPPTEIKPRNRPYFDYYAKYTTGASQEITPAALTSHVTAKIQQIALTCHDILRCRVLSRTDMILAGQKIYVLETNSIPGLTPTSLLPQAAAAAKISFEKLIDHIIQTSLYFWKKNFRSRTG